MSEQSKARAGRRPRWAARFGAAIGLALIGAGATPSAAQDCGGEVACATPGGRYHIEQPEGVAPGPAVMFLHGWGGSGEGQMRNRGLVSALLARGYAVIAPTGQPRGQGRSGARWNAFQEGSPFRAGLRDDVAFLGRVADDAAARFGLDRDRMLLAGFSGGGMMTWRVACDAPGSFAAYAPVAGLLWRPLPERCAGAVKLLHTHGWSDTVTPIEGRSVAGGRLTQGDLFVGLDLLRRTNGCAKDDPDAYAATGVFQQRRWSACAPGSALELALWPGAHATPRGWSALALNWFEGLGR